MENGLKRETRWLLAWLQNRGPMPDASLEELLQFNYLQAGVIDSFGVIELISEVEEHFDIRFDAAHFQERRFTTVGGLSDIIAELSIKRDETER